MNFNSIGLDRNKSNTLISELNLLLANFQMYYQNLRGLHWNIKGKGFFDLHAKFEELYDDANTKVDEIAERILTLGGIPLHTFLDYQEKAEVPVGKNISKDEDAIHLIVESLTKLLQVERPILDHSGEIGDEGTNSLISDLIKEQEKTIWMFKAWLSESV